MTTDDHAVYTYVRAAGAFACIATLNVLVLMSFLNPEASVPKWSIYMLIVLIGGLLGLDALLEISPVRVAHINDDGGEDDG